MGFKQRAPGLPDRVSECRTTGGPRYRQANTSRRASYLYETWQKQGENSEVVKAIARKISVKRDIWRKSMSNNICFKSKWFEKCLRDYLGLDTDVPITEEMLASIKYLYVSTTNDYELAFGKEELPVPFKFRNAGDEWNFRCISYTGRFQNLEEFVEIRKRSSNTVLCLNDELLKQEKELQKNKADLNKELMNDFEENIKTYWAEEEDYEGLTEDEDSYDLGMLFSEDFAYFTNLETVRLMSCEIEIHSLKFLEALSKLKVLEIGEVRLHDLDGLNKLIGLDKLCIWSN